MKGRASKKKTPVKKVVTKSVKKPATKSGTKTSKVVAKTTKLKQAKTTKPKQGKTAKSKGMVSKIPKEKASSKETLSKTPQTKSPTAKIAKPKKIVSKTHKLKPKVVETVTKPAILSKTNKHGMDDFQQCVVLAAIVNQHRNRDPKFLFIPLPDINSSALSPLRELLGHYDFTASDIVKAVKHVEQSKTFTECFPAEGVMKKIDLKITKNKPGEILVELFELAGPEAKKPIYLADKNPHDIHKTTLEKHALKLGLIDPHLVTAEQQIRHDHDFAHKQSLMKLNFQKMGRGFGGNLQRILGNQRRGRG